MSTKSPFGGATGTRKQITPISVIEVNGLKVQVNMPPATKSRHDSLGQEVVQGLARYAPIQVVNVNDLPECPASWQRSDPSQNIGSFLFRAQTEHMVWLDLNANRSHRHDVAAIISAQGLNALTGQQLVPPIRLQQFSELCPVHGCAFEEDRLCPQCGFKWPGQNYIATTSCRSGAFWRDGFRGADGKTREFVFTDDPGRGVAAQLIGEDRCHALGIALFTSKEPKPQPVYRGYRGDGLLGGGLESFGASKGIMRSCSLGAPEVAAGALVRQEVEADKYRLDYWNYQAPDALVNLYYLGAEAFDALVGQAVRGGRNEGFLGGGPVGNP